LMKSGKVELRLFKPGPRVRRIPTGKALRTSDSRGTTIVCGF